MKCPTGWGNQSLCTGALGHPGIWLAIFLIAIRASRLHAPSMCPYPPKEAVGKGTASEDLSLIYEWYEVR